MFSLVLACPAVCDSVLTLVQSCVSALLQTFFLSAGSGNRELLLCLCVLKPLCGSLAAEELVLPLLSGLSVLQGTGLQLWPQALIGRALLLSLAMLPYPESTRQLLLGPWTWGEFVVCSDFSELSVLIWDQLSHPWDLCTENIGNIGTTSVHFLANEETIWFLPLAAPIFLYPDAYHQTVMTSKPIPLI